MSDKDKYEQFAREYAELCQKHFLCIAPANREDDLCITTLKGGGGWVETVILSAQDDGKLDDGR